MLGFILSFAVASAECFQGECPSKAQALLQVAKSGGYEIGGDNTQSCSHERERLETVAECQEAAGALGKMYGFTGSYAGWPLYCFMYRDVIYFNENRVSSSGRADARLICRRVPATTTTTSPEALENNVSYVIGTPGLDCQEGHVVSSYSECASMEVHQQTHISFSNWLQLNTMQFGCLYNSNTHSLFFNYFEGGQVDYSFSPVCKTESNPVIRHFHRQEFNTNVCASGQPIEDVELCREAAAIMGEIFSTEGSYSGYPAGCLGLQRSLFLAGKRRRHGISRP